MNQPLTTALRLARLPANGIERHVVATSLIPHLQPGENVDTGALRILADRVGWLDGEAEECRVMLHDVASGRVDSRVKQENDVAQADNRMLLDQVARIQSTLDAYKASGRMLEEKVQRLTADLVKANELVEKLIHENRTLSGPVPPIVRGEVDPPKEIIDLAWKLHDSMRANGYRNWRLAGVCDSMQVDRLTAELAEARAENKHLNNHIEQEHVAGWKRIQAILPEKPLESASSLVADILGCIEQLRAENGRQAATIAAMRLRVETPHTGRDDKALFRDWMESQPTDVLKPEPISLEVGKTYVNRVGRAETILYRDDKGIHPFVSINGLRFAEDGSHDFGERHRFDLVALAPTADPVSSHP